jgi:hypothetical protein
LVWLWRKYCARQHEIISFVQQCYRVLEIVCATPPEDVRRPVWRHYATTATISSASLVGWGGRGRWCKVIEMYVATWGLIVLRRGPKSWLHLGFCLCILLLLNLHCQFQNTRTPGPQGYLRVVSGYTLNWTWCSKDATTGHAMVRLASARNCVAIKLFTWRTL